MKLATMILGAMLLTNPLSLLQATTFTSKGTGAWTAPGTWTITNATNAHTFPQVGDDVFISAKHDVTLDATAECNSLTINGGNGNGNQAQLICSSYSLSINGNLVIGSNGTLTAGNNGITCTISGNWTNTGIFNAGNSMVIFRGATGSQSIGGSASTFNNLHVWNSSGVALSANVTVAGGLHFISGNLNTGAYTLTLGPAATLTGETSGSYLLGTCTTTRPNVTIGTAVNNFGGIGTELKTISGTMSLGNVTVTRKAGPGSAVAFGSSTSINRKWTISVGTQPSSSVSLTLRWVSDDNNGKAFSANYAQMWHSTDGVSNWIPVGPQDIAAQDQSDQNLWSFSASPTSFSTFTISDQNNALPVELTSFTANRRGSDVSLAWRTATEANNHGFEIERSTGHDAWDVIGFVAGAGTSNTPRSYAFRDDVSSLATSVPAVSYRLKQIDRDGKITYSDAVSVTFSPAVSGIVLRQNYPNPFNPSTNITFNLPSAERVTLAVYNELGTEVARLFDNATLEGGQHTAAFDGSSLPSGLYFCRLGTASSAPQSIRMLISK